MKKQLLAVIILLAFVKLYGNDNFRFSFGTEFYQDNNIFERINDNRIASNLFQYSILGNYNNKIGKNAISLRYNGNFQNYYDYGNENKLYQKFYGDFYRPLSSRNIIYLKGYFSQKSWFQVDKLYNNSCINLGIITKNNSISNYTEIHSSTANYNFFEEYNCQDYGIRNIIIKKVSPRFSINGKFDFKLVDYLNNFIHKRRFDRNYQFDFGFEYQNKLIIGSNFIMNHLVSNYNFLSNYSLTFSPYLSAEFYGFYYQLIARWNVRKYQHKISLNNVSISYPDPEENTNNQLFFGFERKVFKELYLTGKVIYFSSEYKYQSDNYEKFMAGAGLKVKL